MDELSFLEKLSHQELLARLNETEAESCENRFRHIHQDGYCPPHSDGVMCWEPTAPGTVAYKQCFDEFDGVKYDTSQNATRNCSKNGIWSNYTDYSRCHESGDLPEHENTGAELITHIYLAGYSLSLAALLLAVGVFLYFKDLKCLRNTIHTNLMCTYILYVLMWILNLIFQLSAQKDNVSCLILVIFVHYFFLTNFFWMLVEGLYLYMLVVETFTGENIKLRVYASIGWGAPAVFIIIWTIVRIFIKAETVPGETGEQLGGMRIECTWMTDHPGDWIYKVPAMAGLVLNLVFLIRIMWVLITKLRSANTLETQQYRKATKALLVLIPLLGLTYLLVLYVPESGYGAQFFVYVRPILISTQGFIVALFYCFLNTEVQNAIKHHVERWKARRSVGGGKRYNYTYTKDWSPRSRTESIRLNSQPTNFNHKRESTASEITTTTLVTIQTNSKASMLSRPPNSISPKYFQPGTESTMV